MTVRPTFSAGHRRRAWLMCGVLVAAAAIVLPGLAGGGASGAFSGPPPPPDLAACRIADDPASAAGYDQWAETLLDTAHTVGPEYVPPDLVRMPGQGRGVRLRAFVVPELEALLAAALEDGVTMTVTSGFRSFERQARTVLEAAAAHGQDSALLWAARPGHSEHQLGTTVDLSGGADWLREHAWRFGFVMSYPAERSPAMTCYLPEPWHYRYFGRQRAAAITASGLSPREWLWQRHQVAAAAAQPLLILR